MRSRLAMSLPPFAADYSGVCSALFPLGGMICIHDASGCTGNYALFDEPRWYGSRSSVYCTGLRKTDAALGDDEKLIRKICAAAHELKPAFIAIVGSPVPNVIGFDFRGVARELEAELGIPAFGFPTAGMEGSYQDGIAEAWHTLFARFAKGKQSGEARTLNLCGLSPLDLTETEEAYFAARLRSAGYRVRSTGLDNIRRFGSATVNLALTTAGLRVAKEAEKIFGTPYLAGFPIGEEAWKSYFEMLLATEESGVSRVFAPEAGREEKHQTKATWLLFHDALIAHSLRSYLRSRGKEVHCKTVFPGQEAEDLGVEVCVKEERIAERINEEGFDGIAADPLLLALRFKKGIAELSLPQHAVSSRVCEKERWNLLDEEAWKYRIESEEER